MSSRESLSGDSFLIRRHGAKGNRVGKTRISTKALPWDEWNKVSERKIKE